MSALLLTFAALAVLSLTEALWALRGGVRYYRLFRHAPDAPVPSWTPPVTLIVPCRDVDHGLNDNLRAYCTLDYPDYRLLFVTGERDDPCVAIVERVRAEFPRLASRLLFAGHDRRRGQKVHALLHATAHAPRREEVLAFGDSDGRPRPEWLRHLVTGLAWPEVGLTTGFRWYLPQRGGFASALRSVWNASAATVFHRRDAPFAWGGAMAIRRETFEAVRARDHWDRALSDDFALSRAVHAHGLRIRFEPRAMVFTHEDCTLGELLNWSFRQMAITRVYRPGLWWVGFGSELFGNVVFWGGLGVLLRSLLGGLPLGWAGTVLVMSLGGIYAARAAKGWLRLAAVRALFPDAGRRLERYRTAYLLWGPLSSLVMLAALLRSATRTTIAWRGVRYRMVSRSDTVVLD